MLGEIVLSVGPVRAPGPYEAGQIWVSLLVAVSLSQLRLSESLRDEPRVVSSWWPAPAAGPGHRAQESWPGPTIGHQTPSPGQTGCHIVSSSHFPSACPRILERSNKILSHPIMALHWTLLGPSLVLHHLNSAYTALHLLNGYYLLGSLQSIITQTRMMWTNIIRIWRRTDASF